MVGLLPEDIAVVVLGPGGAALGWRLRTALAGARLHGPRAHPGDWDESYDRVSTQIGDLFEIGQAIVGVCAAGILIHRQYRRFKRTTEFRALKHDPEKWAPVFPRDKRGTRLRGDHAQTGS